MITDLRFLTVSLLALAVAAVGAEPGGAQSGPPTWAVQGQVAREHAAEADFQEHTGSLGVDTLTYEARLFWNPARGTRLGFGLGGGFWDYDGSMMSGEPLLRAHRLRIGGLQMLTPHWGALAQLAVGVAYDSRTPMRDGLTNNLFVGPLWRRDEDLFLAVGLYRTAADQHAKIIPMLSLWWRMDEHWSLTIFDQIDNLSRFTWRANELFSAGVRLDVQQIQFALERPIVTGVASSFRDTHATIGVEGDWRPFASETFTVRPHAGWVVSRTVAFTDREGNKLLSESTDSAPAFGLTLLAAF
jgi:hypothetical protein